MHRTTRSVLVGVLALACVAACGRGDATRKARSAPAPSTEASGLAAASPVASAPASAQPETIIGNCNAQGHHIVVTCTGVPQSMARVSFEPAPIFHFWFDGTPDQLPTPPPYELASGHCREWDKWLRATPGIHFDRPVTDMQLLAGEPDVVQVSTVEVEIHRRTARPAGGGTWVQCNWGGGSDVFYNVDVDTAKRATTVLERNVDDGEERSFQMPPRSIGLSNKGYRDVRISINSQPGYRYEGALVIRATLNGKAVVYTVGTKDRPLRWISSADAERDGITFHGWDQKKQRWVRGFAPFEE